MINIIVPSQNFELVRDRISDIIKNECVHQAGLMNAAVPNSGNYLLSTDVITERKKPIDKVEIPTVNVSVMQDDFSNKDQRSVSGLVAYAIDVYTSGKQEVVAGQEIPGDVISSIRLQKLLGFLRYVLEDPIYKTLNFTPGFIGRTYVSGFQIRAYDPNDADNQSMARLTFNVLMKESNALLVPPLVAGSQTTMVIDYTALGYFSEEIY